MPIVIVNVFLALVEHERLHDVVCDGRIGVAEVAIAERFEDRERFVAIVVCVRAKEQIFSVRHAYRPRVAFHRAGRRGGGRGGGDSSGGRGRSRLLRRRRGGRNARRCDGGAQRHVLAEQIETLVSNLLDEVGVRPCRLAADRRRPVARRSRPNAVAAECARDAHDKFVV